MNVEKENAFYDRWQEIRSRGEKNYLFKQTAKLWFILLIIFMISNFLIYSLDVTLEEITNKLFKNIFITFIIALVIVANIWRRNERRYEKIKQRKDNNAELAVNKMRNQVY